jgi:glycosyltransferase involved in cell wall biosynthesis
VYAGPRFSVCYVVLKGMPLGGGIEKYTEEVGSRLAQRGHRVIVYAMRHYGTEFGRFKGMEVRPIPTLRMRSFEKLCASFLATLWQTVRRECDIVHCHAFGTAVFCGLPRLTGRRVVVQGHGIEWKRAKWSTLGRVFLRLSEAPSVACPNAVTVVSRTQQRYLKDTYRISSEYIPNGINEPTYETPELIRRLGLESRGYILFLSRLVREKGAHHLIRAYNRLRTDAKLVVAGDAQHEEEYKQELQSLAGGNPNIVFPGFATGRLLHELLSHARVFVLPSEIEGMSIALLEAMSYGNCCLVSDIPENLETVQGHAYTFRNANVDDLAERLGCLAANGDPLIAATSRGAQEHVLRYHTWDAVADRMEALYARVLGHATA